MSQFPIDYAVVIIPTLPLFIFALLILLCAIVLYCYFFMELLPNSKELEKLFRQEQAEEDKREKKSKKDEEGRQDKHPPSPPAAPSGLVTVELKRPIRESYNYAQ